MGKSTQDITILVCSCDSYSDLWEPFFKLLKKYWKDCPYKIVLNTESKVFQYEGLDIACYSLFPEKQVPYGERMLAHLNHIETPYVLILMDDFFIRKNVDVERIQQCKHWMMHNSDIAVFSFAYVPDSMNIEDSQYPGFEKRPQYGEYKVNLQCGLWRIDALKKYIKPHVNPWQLELLGTQQTFWSNDIFYVLQEDTPRIIDYGKTRYLDWGIVRGKWMIEDVGPLFKKNNIEVDFSSRGVLYKKDVEAVRHVNMDCSEWDKIKSIGFVQWSRIQLWRLVRLVRKILRLPVDTDYIAYLRRKHDGR